MIRSMTAFVFHREVFPWGEIRVNIRSGNFKYLDIYISQLPLGAESLEKDIFEEVLRKIRGGRVQISITGILGEGSLPQDFLPKVRKAFSVSLKELIEFKEAQGQRIEEEIRQLEVSLKRRSQSFKEYLKKRDFLPDEDISEEVSLISFYLEHLNKILKKERKRVGKILDFLSQELLREINTILSKIKEKKLCLEAIYFKEEVDRLRELAQNIE